MLNFAKNFIKQIVETSKDYDDVIVCQSKEQRKELAADLFRFLAGQSYLIEGCTWADTTQRGHVRTLVYKSASGVEYVKVRMFYRKDKFIVVQGFFIKKEN